MDIKNSFALRKKRELLGNISKRKMSLRKHMDAYKQNECSLDITQITKCVFLGSLCLKPVPHLFDSPLLLQELDMKVGNVRSDVNDENNGKTSTCEKNTSTKDPGKKGTRKKCLSTTKMKKKSLREKNDSKITSNGVHNIKVESIEAELKELPEIAKVKQASPKDKVNNPPEIIEVKFVTCRDLDKEIGVLPEPSSLEASNNNNEDEDDIIVAKVNGETVTEALDETPDSITVETPDNITVEEILDIKTLSLRISSKADLDAVQMGVKTADLPSVDYDEDEMLKREQTPELILSDSDEDAIDQLMFNIMDIKVEQNVFNKEFFDMPPSDIEEFEEYSNEFEDKSDTAEPRENSIAKEKKYIKRNPQCKICSQVFSSYMQLKKHKQDHNGDKPYLCLKCNENHTTLDQLIAHLRTHQGKRPYVCKKCNKGFKSTKALENHQPVHVLRKAVPQKKAFRCEVCRKEFRKLCDLERHTRVHTGEKPSVCNICNRRFQQAHNLNKHLLIHTQEKPYECDICNKKFGRNDVLNRHLLTHSVKKPNRCEICMKSFIRVSQLLAHKEKYHTKKAS